MRNFIVKFLWGFWNNSSPSSNLRKYAFMLPIVIRIYEICYLQNDELRRIVLFGSIVIIELLLSYHEEEMTVSYMRRWKKFVIIKRD